MVIDPEDKKVVLKWLLNQGVVSIIFIAFVTIIGYLGLREGPRFVDAAIQVPVELNKLNNNFAQLENTLTFINEREGSNEKKNIEILRIVQENNAILRQMH